VSIDTKYDPYMSEGGRHFGTMENRTKYVPAQMWILDSYFRFIRQLNIYKLFLSTNVGGEPLKQHITVEQRKELEVKMAKVFHRNIKELSAELQRILLDDLVTAFQNRINVLIRAQDKGSY
jgi:hypothetical protein